MFSLFALGIVAATRVLDTATRRQLATACGVEPSDGSFKTALKQALEDGSVVKEKHGTYIAGAAEEVPF